MCMIDYGDGTVRMLENARLVTALKRHKCAECWRQIEVGEKYHREKFVFDDEFTTHKTCAHCMVVRNWLADECGGWLFGEVQEDAADHARGSGPDLARVVIGMRWKWRGPSGRLLPVPARIQTGDELRLKKG